MFEKICLNGCFKNDFWIQWFNITSEFKITKSRNIPIIIVNLNLHPNYSPPQFRICFKYVKKWINDFFKYEKSYLETFVNLIAN